MDARARLAALVDPGSFREIGKIAGKGSYDENSELTGVLPAPFLFGKAPTMADAMYAPVCTRFLTYAVKLDSECATYCRTVMDMPWMKEWVAAALLEPDDVEELEVEF